MPSVNFAENVIFSNFGTKESTAVSKGELERLLQGKPINRTKRRRIDDLMFEIERQRGSALETVVDNSLFSKIFTIPIVLYSPNFQHVFEFTRFTQRQVSQTRTITKIFTDRDIKALRQTTVINFISDRANGIVQNASEFWIIVFNFSE